MSAGLAKPHLLTFEEFLDFEETSSTRHEYHQGRLVEMTFGVSEAHDIAAGNTFAAIHAKLGGKTPCRVHQSGLALRVEAADAGYYPDIFVTCDPRDRADPRAKRWPSLIIEILSKSTRDYDRGDKFDSYRQIETLREYVLIDSESQGVVIFRPETTGRWVMTELGPDGVLDLESIGLSLPVSTIYAGTVVPLVRQWPRLVVLEP